MNRYADMHRKESPEYKEGDKVWLEGKYISTTRPSKKLEDRRYGPFVIKKIISPTTCRLKLPAGWNMHPTFHVVHLCPALQNCTLHPNRDTRPPPDIIDGAERYKVETILNCRRWGSGYQYHVKWKGYPLEEAKWEPASVIRQDVPKMVKQFHLTHPDKPNPQSRDEIRTLTTTTTPQYLKVMRLLPTASMPVRGTPEAAGFDLAAAHDGRIPAGTRLLVDMGLAIEPPVNSYSRIAPRSGLSVKSSIDVGAGVIDRDYRDEVKVLLINNGTSDFVFRQGDRIAQLIIENISLPLIRVTRDLSATARQASGFGSTGL